MAPVIESAGVRLLIVLCVVVCTVLLSNQYLEELLPQVKVSAEVAWGLVSKGYGLLYVMVFASFHSQVVPLCGKKGVSPVSDLLSRASKDFPGYRKVLYFPTLLWLDDSDAMLVGLNGVGLLAGLLAICGGLAGWLGLLVARVCLQSLAVAGEFWYVWDYMVLEAGALVLLLPTSAPLPALGLTSTPAPCVALAWQFLAIRLMLGFAKTKFGGARVFEDNLYLQGFFIWQLLPNRLSWYLHHAPLWFLRAGYVFMLYVEVILPLCAFWGGAPRYIAACGLIALMFGIYLTGNWGTFNFGYAIVCVGLFDLDVAYSSFFSARELGDCFWSDILLRPLMTVYMFLSLIYCVFDTWTNTSWPYYYWEIIPEFQLHGLIGLIRLLGPFRLISSYGVFPPEALPQVRTTLVYEGSQDGKTWKTYPYRYQPHSCQSVPCRLAPHHARLDHRAHYPFEVTSKSDLTSAYSLTDHNPYCYSPVSFAHRVAQRLLEGEESVLGLFASNPFPEKAPAFVRVTGYGLSPCSIAHHQKTGNWWHAQQLCEVVPSRQTDPSIWQRWVPHAECFHPEHEVWRSRSGPVQALRASDPSDVDAAVFCEGIGKDEVAAFWSEFIPSVQRARGDWISLPSRARELAERTAPAKLALYERILARYVLLLLRQVSPQLVQQIGIAILFGTWRLHLLLHDVVAEGKDAYLDTLKNPESLLPRAEKIQDPQLLDLLGLLRPADLQFEDCKFHYHYAAKQRPDRRGFLKSICEFDYGGMYSFVKFMAQQPSLSPLWLPKAELLNSGAWIVEGYQDQGEATASTSLSAPLVR